MLQETGCTPRQRGYATRTNSKVSSNTAILLQKHLTVMQHSFDHIPGDHIIVEISPPRKRQENTLTLNIYSPPKDKVTNFAPLYANALKLEKHNNIKSIRFRRDSLQRLHWCMMRCTKALDSPLHEWFTASRCSIAHVGTAMSLRCRESLHPLRRWYSHLVPWFSARAQ